MDYTRNGECPLNHVFNDLEGLRIAAEMERRGEAFYRNAARVSKSRAVIDMLNSLAEDERIHMAEFNRLYDEAANRQEFFEPYSDEANAYLTAIAADIVFPGGLMALRHTGFESPEAVLEHAISSEKDSILFYTELARCSIDENARATFLEITRQETAHLQRLSYQLSTLLQGDRK